MSKLPLHAAGRHSESYNQSVLDRVTSSYASSIRAIIYGRKRRELECPPTATNQALLVAMQDTPGNNILRFVNEEVDVLQDLFKSMTLDPVKPERLKENVLSHLLNCKIFHFAGYGYTDNSDPSQSSLLLKDWERDKLTVADLLDINLGERLPFLAYLSACGTGKIEDGRFLDESIHLISACQLAGFRHVIGTLWEVNDQTCVDVARITYESIGIGGMTDRSVTEGLHKATRELRDCWLKNSVNNRRAQNRVVKDIGDPVD